MGTRGRLLEPFGYARGTVPLLTRLALLGVVDYLDAHCTDEVLVKLGFFVRTTIHILLRSNSMFLRFTLRLLMD